jgi:hypothetical protein
MRAKIYRHKDFYSSSWISEVNGDLKSFLTFEAALKDMNKRLKRVYKEASAYSIARTISSNLLSIDEGTLVRKLNKSKCKGITPKQYGYLKGIHERQQREW